MIPCPWQHFNGAWLAAFSSLANNHLWRNQSPGLGGHTDSLQGPTVPLAVAGLPLSLRGLCRQSPTLEVVPLAKCCLPGLDAVVTQAQDMENGWIKAPSFRACRVPARATEERRKCMSRRLNPTLCFRGYNLTSGLKQVPRATRPLSAPIVSLPAWGRCLPAPSQAHRPKHRPFFLRALSIFLKPGSGNRLQITKSSGWEVLLSPRALDSNKELLSHSSEAWGTQQRALGGAERDLGLPELRKRPARSPPFARGAPSYSSVILHRGAACELSWGVFRMSS